MLRIVLDTNVVLDLFHFADPAVRPIRAALAAGEAECVADAATLEELARVLTYPQFGMSAEAGAALLAAYGDLVRAAPPAAGNPPLLPRCRDPDDQKFLELAARTGADLLVSKDKALLRLRRRCSGFRIAPPLEAAALFSSRA